jgi:hypothetical protein
MILGGKALGFEANFLLILKKDVKVGIASRIRTMKKRFFIL